MQWKLVDGKVTINGKPVSIHSDRLIKKAFEIGELLILLIDYLPALPILEQTVIAVDEEGHLQWRIKTPERVLGPNPITGLWMEGDQLLGFLAAGMDIKIDPRTGDWELRDPNSRPW